MQFEQTDGGAAVDGLPTGLQFGQPLLAWPHQLYDGSHRTGCGIRFRLPQQFFLHALTEGQLLGIELQQITSFRPQADLANAWPHLDAALLQAQTADIIVHQTPTLLA